MNHMPHKLSRTIGICTACSGFIILHNRTSAGRTYCRKYKRLCIRRMFTYGKNLGNNLASFTNYNRISDTNPLFFNKITIMQSCTADGCACKQNRFKNSDRSQDSCSAYIYFNVKQFCCFFFRRILICLRPLGIFSRTSQSTACLKTVYLNNGAVNCVVKFAAAVSDLLNLLKSLINRVTHLVKRCWKTKLGKIIKALSVRFKFCSCHLLNIKNKYI